MTQTSETLLKPRKKRSFDRRDDLGIVAHIAEDERRIFVQLLGSGSQNLESQKLEALGFIQVPGHEDCYVRYNSELRRQYAEDFNALLVHSQADNDQVLVSLGL